MRLAVNKPQQHKLISLTPLIDVIFILLLFFMLTTQFQRQQATTLQTGSLSADVATPVDETIMSFDDAVNVQQMTDVIDTVNRAGIDDSLLRLDL